MAVHPDCISTLNRSAAAREIYAHLTGSVRPLSSGETDGVSVTDVPDLGRGRPLIPLMATSSGGLHSTVVSTRGLRGLSVDGSRWRTSVKPLTAIGLSPNGVTVVGVLVAAGRSAVGVAWVATASSVAVGGVGGCCCDRAAGQPRRRSSGYQWSHLACGLRAGFSRRSIQRCIAPRLIVGSRCTRTAGCIDDLRRFWCRITPGRVRAPPGLAGGCCQHLRKAHAVVIVSVSSVCVLWPLWVSVSTWATARRVHGAGRCVDWGSSGRGSAGRSAARVTTHKRFSGKTLA